MFPELARAVEIGTRIQGIARQAFEMQLEATNAIVVTRSRGVAVPGFEAVAEQMGVVSRQLAQEVGPLRVATSAWIGVVSAQIRDAREIAMLEAAARAAPAMETTVARVVAPLRAHLTERAAIERARRAFARAIDDVHHTVATGCVLARTAKIEAAYGAALVQILAETAERFTLLADTLDESVRTIARWLRTSTRAS